MGDISGPINARSHRRGGQDTDKQEPSADEIAKNLDQTREQMLEERHSESFNIFVSNVVNDYKKHNRIRLNAKAQAPTVPGE